MSFRFFDRDIHRIRLHGGRWAKPPFDLLNSIQEHHTYSLFRIAQGLFKHEAKRDETVLLVRCHEAMLRAEIWIQKGSLYWMSEEKAKSLLSQVADSLDGPLNIDERLESVRDQIDLALLLSTRVGMARAILRATGSKKGLAKLTGVNQETIDAHRKTRTSLVNSLNNLWSTNNPGFHSAEANIVLLTCLGWDESSLEGVRADTGNRRATANPSVLVNGNHSEDGESKVEDSEEDSDGADRQTQVDPLMDLTQIDAWNWLLDSTILGERRETRIREVCRRLDRLTHKFADAGLRNALRSFKDSYKRDPKQLVELVGQLHELIEKLETQRDESSANIQEASFADLGLKAYFESLPEEQGLKWQHIEELLREVTTEMHPTTQDEEDENKWWPLHRSTAKYRLDISDNRDLQKIADILSLGSVETILLRCYRERHHLKSHGAFGTWVSSETGMSNKKVSESEAYRNLLLEIYRNDAMVRTILDDFLGRLREANLPGAEEGKPSAREVTKLLVDLRAYLEDSRNGFKDNLERIKSGHELDVDDESNFNKNIRVLMSKVERLCGLIDKICNQGGVSEKMQDCIEETIARQGTMQLQWERLEVQLSDLSPTDKQFQCFSALKHLPEPLSESDYWCAEKHRKLYEAILQAIGTEEQASSTTPTQFAFFETCLGSHTKEVAAQLRERFPEAFQDEREKIVNEWYECEVAHEYLVDKTEADPSAAEIGEQHWLQTWLQEEKTCTPETEYLTRSGEVKDSKKAAALYAVTMQYLQGCIRQLHKVGILK
ncbi:hypothetical protein [Adhaeretor mobilis]|uniref:Uncharacterized protein n=1 Tax=Adhaeretor mobilis TaxID=1930276 RepID=A0A517MQP3_9BACT|nr:hypothetical protein [Adhaeretor mobilis]QDS97206.1 hypothetical protein HG15A2_04660 [Adhaeretor mobilis]